MRQLFLLTVILAIICPSLGAQENSKEEAVVRLPPFVVTPKDEFSLKMRFRNHLIFRGLRDLTFTVLPPSWQKTGIKTGDHVIAIDGKPVYGMGVIEFRRMLEGKMRPLNQGKVQEVPLTFEIESKDSNRLWNFVLVAKRGDRIIF